MGHSNHTRDMVGVIVKDLLPRITVPAWACLDKPTGDYVVAWYRGFYTEADPDLPTYTFHAEPPYWRHIRPPGEAVNVHRY